MDQNSGSNGTSPYGWQDNLNQYVPKETSGGGYVPSTTGIGIPPTYWPIQPQQPCPTCGRCPTCGKKNGRWVITFGYPGYYWQEY